MDEITLDNLMKYADNRYADDDLRQEFLLGAVEALDKYLPERGKLLTFLIRCGNNKAIKLMEHEKIYRDHNKRLMEFEERDLG